MEYRKNSVISGNTTHIVIGKLYDISDFLFNYANLIEKKISEKDVYWSFCEL